MKDKKLPFIILAGSPPERDKLMEYADVEYKSLIDIHGKPMLTHIIEAIHGSDMASYILIIGIPRSKFPLPDGIGDSRIEFHEIMDTPVDKIMQSAKYLLEKGKKDPSIFPAKTPHAIMMTSDIPAITPTVIKRFLAACGDRSACFYYAAVHQSFMDNRFPNNGRSWIKIDRENYCGGDIDLCDLTQIEPSYPLIKKIIENRKSFVKALFWASPLTFFKFILKRIGMKDAEGLMKKIFGFECRLIISEDAEVAFDVDKPFQLDVMRKYFYHSESMQS